MFTDNSTNSNDIVIAATVSTLVVIMLIVIASALCIVVLYKCCNRNSKNAVPEGHLYETVEYAVPALPPPRVEMAMHKNSSYQTSRVEIGITTPEEDTKPNQVLDMKQNIAYQTARLEIDNTNATLVRDIN